MSSFPQFPSTMVRVRDCFGNQYAVRPMAGTGLCGFHCLSYCLTGSQGSYGDIIEDCISVFKNIPDLFRLRTNFGSRRDSLVTLDDYRLFINDAVSRVDAGLELHPDAWCEDGHFAAIALLYDLMICTYSLVNKQWQVFNESARGGYVTLLSLPGHFDLLTGVNGAPIIPPGAYTHGVTRDAYNSSEGVWQSLQRNYAFTFVYKLPEGFNGIDIVNRPVISMKTTVNQSPVVSTNVRSLSADTDWKTVSSKKKRLYECDFPGCRYTGKNFHSVNMHKIRCHCSKESPHAVAKMEQMIGEQSTSHIETERDSERNLQSGETDVDVMEMVRFMCQEKRKSLINSNKAVLNQRAIDETALKTNNKNVHECNFPGCRYTSDNAQAVKMHKVRCHRKKQLSITVMERNQVNEKEFSVVSDNDSIINKEMSEMDVQSVTVRSSHQSSVCRKINTDVSSVMSCETTSSRRSERIAQKPPVSYAQCVRENVVSSSNVTSSADKYSETVQRKNIMYECNFPNCHYVNKKIKNVNLHKIRCHTNKESANIVKQTKQVFDKDLTIVNNNQSVINKETAEIHLQCLNIPCDDASHVCSEVSSVTSADTVGSRRSQRIAQKRRVFYGPVRQQTVARNDAYMYEAIDCCADDNSVKRNTKINNRKRTSVVLDKEAELSQVKRSKIHSTTTTDALLEHDRQCTETIIENENTANIKNSLRGKSFKSHRYKQHVKETFSDKIAHLEKEILPKRKILEQTDVLYDKLKNYHDTLLKSVTNTTVEKISPEVLDVITNPALIDDCDSKFLWSKEDESRLNELNKTCKLLQPRSDWTWGAEDDSEQGQYNDKRMQLCVTHECQWKVIECKNCGSTGLLVGDQTDSSVCRDCVELGNENARVTEQKQEAWSKVSPATKEYPKTASGQDLPYLDPGDKAVLSPLHPACTVTKTVYGDKRLRQESITLVQNPLPIWCKILPRTSLTDRFMIIERRVRDAVKHIVANADRVRQWLRYLFLHHGDFIRLRRQNELVIDENAIESLGPDLELAEVDYGLAEETVSEMQTTDEEIVDQEGLTDATVTSGFSDSHVFSFDKFPELYLKTKDVLRIRKEGKLEIVKDDSIRKPTYSASANLAFPHLYLHGEMSPLDFGDNKLARYLLKKQTMFAHRMSDGQLNWTFSEDDVHMAHQYARLSEQTVRANVGYYLSSHPSVAHIPLSSIITAFRDGVDKDSGLLDSHLPDLTTIMSQLPNSRQKWFSERLGIEAICRDVGSPNVFITINLDPRASPDVRRLIYYLEHGKEMDRKEPFVKDNAEFTRLMNKYAPHIAVYLYRKVKIMMRVFFTKICGIPEKEPKGDWRQQDVTETGWYWGRVEFTETRGVQHWHFLAKLPHVLDTGLLGRIIHNSRIVRQEMKCGNIKPEKREEAWQMIEIGLLASRYASLFAHSISVASFYTEDVDIDGHQDDKVIHLEDYRKEYVKNYKEGNINLKTHPIMRRFDDPECRESQFHEMAEVASVSCLHQCIRASCGGDPLSGDGCRFDFPKKELKQTVAAVMQVNANQMEARILLRRTCNRVANLNRYFIRYLRSNHDFSVLIDSAHALRYATKYCAKSGKHAQLLDEMIDYMNKRSTDLLPPNTKQVLTHLLLADCSHRAFMSKQELAYKVMGLPEIIKSFSNVQIVGFYKRANLQLPYDDISTIEYSDRTEYSAYAERCRDDTELGRGLTRQTVNNMHFKEFAETVNHKWINSKTVNSTVIDETTKRKFRTRDINTGHWRFTLCSRRKHIRPSTVLHTAPAIDYEYVEHGKTTTQTAFFDLSVEKRHQLYRAYYELVMHIPWKSTPDETLLSDKVRALLDNRQTHGEIDSRHSLQRLEEFFTVYKKFFNDGKVAIPGSAWRDDNRFSETMFHANNHNRDIHLDRVDNRGMLKAQYEDVDELQDVDVDIRPTMNDVTDDSEYPTLQNFMPPDVYRNIVQQKPMDLSEICVAFPLQYQWQHLEEVVTHDTIKRFIANPPPCPINYEDMTPIQKFAVNMGIDKNQQILFLCGKAGSGKTAVALKICEYYYGRVQATAYTGKAASIFNGPTIHSMFGWSHNEHTSALTEVKPDSKKVQEFRVAHEGIELFVIEEALAVPPAHFALIDEVMTAAFNPQHTLNSERELSPFGGKKMLFLGDQAQLPPIGGPTVYGDGHEATKADRPRRESKQSKRTKAGQLIYEKYLKPNCIYLQRGQRNTGLLGEICDRMREGKLTENDWTMLTHQRTRYPDLCADYGIHYQNEMCTMHNLRQLSNECLLATPARRIFICKATYHVTSNNDHIVDALSTLPPQAYDYAPDILCVAKGCQVRLLYNVNIAAGLVTSQTGTVVNVIYNNADVSSVLAGEHVVPYCIVVSFAGFQGFLVKKQATCRRVFPFPNQHTWVPIFRKRFGIKIKFLPSWIRRNQLEKDCFRVQFPIDLSRNVTAHRAQGQTMADCLVSVDLGLQNPDIRMPPEIGSLLYVACTRVTKLQNLFLSQIHPCLWPKVGQTEIDKHKRMVDEQLRKAAEKFSISHGMYPEMLEELSSTPDYSKNAEEWLLLQQQTVTPQLITQLTQPTTADLDFDIDLGDAQFRMFCTPVLSERHIGIDQGVNNFAIAVVERTVGENPNIVEAMNYTNLELKKRFKATDVLLTLSQKTNLLSWMKPINNDHKVDRVIVHLEQIDARNRYSKQFTTELGKMLQKEVSDCQKCVVKMSQPHIHRASGPLFHLGDEIVEQLQLQPALYQQRRSRAESNPSAVFVKNFHIDSEVSDVEPSDNVTVSDTRQSESQEYRAKKKMSSDIFRYIIESDKEQMQQMKLSIDNNVQEYWRERIASRPSIKLDDVGDALLHALDELLCGSTNFKQLVPAAPSVHVNRTVAITVFPENTYWIVLNCQWNMFVFENFGHFSSGLHNCYFKNPTTVDTIKRNLTQTTDLWSSLSEFDGDAIYDAVDHIKVVIKQLTGHTNLKLKNTEAGALTDATTKAMKCICDDVIGSNSKLIDRRDRILGAMYSRTSQYRNRKFQVVNSTGKHTNAVLSFLPWMRQNLTEFVDNRREMLSEHEKKIFFHAMLNVARSDANTMEMLQLSPVVKTKLCSQELTLRMQNDHTYTRNIADLVLIAISKNQQHVKAVAANSRNITRTTKPTCSVDQ